jgi:hypothetical protein
MRRESLTHPLKDGSQPKEHPEVIVNNKAAGIKNSPEVLPEEYPVRE